ncbi:MAG: glycerol-3-phosphate 1-O-acyltransferase PlsY [Pseudomonadota bacterium]|jgi:glycerol-3-phosphate acyltransferase PlsY
MFSPDLLAGVLVIGAYLLGSVSFAVLVSRAFGLPDPRTYGSGNPGATNVLRSGRRWAAVLTLAGDALKGVAAVLLARWVAVQSGLASDVIALVAVAVFLGHLYPVFFRFQGGKGVATAAGVLFALDLRLGFAVLAVWLVLALGLRLSSLAALAATAIALPMAWGFGLEPPLLAAIAAMAVLLVWRHRSNIRKLLAGTEQGFGSRR